MKLKELDYQTEFYWKGTRYRQLIRPKKPKGKFKVTCFVSGDWGGDLIDMPSGREVKPVIKAVNTP